MDYPGGWRGAAGRRVAGFLNRRPLVSGLLFLVLGAALVGCAFAEDQRTFSGPDPTPADIPGAMVSGFAGGAGLVVL